MDQLNNLISEWRRVDRNPRTLAELEHLVSEAERSGDWSELKARMLQRIEFGTAGLRAKMAMGFGRMNDLVIIQTTQGLASYLRSLYTDQTQTPYVVVGFDTRHNSARFAQLTATVLLNAGLRVYLFSRYCPTPFVPYAVLLLHAAAGIMVTASHNPKDDNGYKVYWANGAQILSPHDRNIAASILAHLEPSADNWDTSLLDREAVAAQPRVIDPLPLVEQSYYRAQAADLLFDRSLNHACPAKLVYTPVHGVGTRYAHKIIKEFGFAPDTLILVPEQCEGDPDFPTVRFPNPEEGPDTLHLAMRTADAHGTRYIIANDPDADRLAYAEKLDSGWKIFSGNEVGIVLGWFAWFLYKERSKVQAASDHGHANKEQLYMFGSTVSTHMLAAIARHENFHYEETLTGFKWMGNRAIDLLQANKEKAHVLFAFEEAIGYMCGTQVFDKDGISGAAMLAQLVAWLHSEPARALLALPPSAPPTLSALLTHLYSLYGYHTSVNSYFLCYDPPTIQRIFDRLRNFSGPNTYPEKCGNTTVKYIRDLTVGYDNSKPDNKPVLPVSKSSQMITFTLELGSASAGEGHVSCSITLRTSGTEPKIKYYSELAASPSRAHLEARDTLDSTLRQLIDSMVAEYLEPERNGLKARGSAPE